MNRARLEFNIVKDQVRRRKEKFIERLTRNLRAVGECRVWTGALRGGRVGQGYPCASFIYKREHVVVDMHRLFLVLRLMRPIRAGYEAGHFMCFNTACVVHVYEQTRVSNRRDSARFLRKKSSAAAQHLSKTPL